jgi:hypothetical protein
MLASFLGVLPILTPPLCGQKIYQLMHMHGCTCCSLSTSCLLARSLLWILVLEDRRSIRYMLLTFFCLILTISYITGIIAVPNSIFVGIVERHVPSLCFLMLFLVLFQKKPLVGNYILFVSCVSYTVRKC